MSYPLDHDAPHEGPIKTPRQLIWTVIASFVVPIAIIVLLVNYVASGDSTGAGTQALSEEAIAQRIQPVGVVMLKDASGATALRTGEEVYNAQCAACHAAGLANAPKFGDEGAWGPRIKSGFDALVHSALKGKGAMAAQGGGEFSDFEIGRAVVFMANKGGAKFDEPKAPAAAASAADAASAAK
jgi:cytochrome c5